MAAWDNAMSPTLTRNQQLGQRFVELASAVRKGETDGATVAARLDDELIPAADQLRAEAASLRVSDAEVARAHAQLVKAWADRTNAWRAAAAAWKQGDLAAFDAADRQGLQAHVGEEEAIAALGTLARARGVEFDPYP